MGSIKQDEIPLREKEWTRNVMESDSSKSEMLKSKLELQEMEVYEFWKKNKSEVELINKKSKDKFEKQIVGLKSMVMDNSKKTDYVSKSLRDKFQADLLSKQELKRDKLAFSISKQIDPIEDVIYAEQLKLLYRNLRSSRYGKSKVDQTIPYQLDANSRYMKLKERFTSLNYNNTKDIPEDFKICIDSKQFKSNELKVIVKDGCVLVQGNHDVKFDDHGLIKREFTRRWFIPEDVKQEKFSCLLDRYGILTVRAPRKVSSTTIPIQTEKEQDMAFRKIS